MMAVRKIKVLELRLALADARAREVAAEIEIGLMRGDPGEFDLLEDLVELDAHADGALGLVLDTRGPHVALVLGRGLPHVEVWWGGVSATSEVRLDPVAVEAFITTWWRADFDSASLG
jgi:hypothetical protein